LIFLESRERNNIENKRKWKHTNKIEGKNNDKEKEA